MGERILLWIPKNWTVFMVGEELFHKNLFLLCPPKRLLRHDFLNMPIHVQVGNTSSLSANEDITQEVWMLNSSDDKDAALVEALQLYGGPGQRILVFVAMKKQCDVRSLAVAPLLAPVDCCGRFAPCFAPR